MTYRIKIERGNKAEDVDVPTREVATAFTREALKDDEVDAIEIFEKREDGLEVQVNVATLLGVFVQKKSETEQRALGLLRKLLEIDRDDPRTWEAISASSIAYADAMSEAARLIAEEEEEAVEA